MVRPDDNLNFKVLGGLFAAVSNDLVFDRLAFVKTSQARLFDSRNVNENVLTAFRWLNEAITFRRVEPLNGAFSHAFLRLDLLSTGNGSMRRACCQAAVIRYFCTSRNRLSR